MENNKNLIHELMVAENAEDAVAKVKANSTAISNTITELNQQEEALNAQLKKIQAQLKTVKAMKDSLKDILTEAVKSTKQQTIFTDDYIFRLKNSGGMKPLIISGEVPDNFQKVVMEPDKKLIRATLETGEKLDFAHFGERKQTLSITPMIQVDSIEPQVQTADIIW